jgi:hypothetical protein
MRLLLALMLMTTPAWADTVYFDDGRVCTRCKVEMSGGYINRVTDKEGTDWDIKPGQRINVDKHPVARRFAQGAAMGAQQMGTQMQQQSQQQQNKQLNCNTQYIGNQAYTNCN